MTELNNYEFFRDGNNYWESLTYQETGKEGSHYTSLETCKQIVEPPLRLYFEKHERDPGYLEKLSSLRILDPSSGVGLLLISAAKILALEIFRVSNMEVEKCLQQVLSQNIYGVDVNKKSIEKSRDLFEHHFGIVPDLRVGNSLLGYTSLSEVENQLKALGIKETRHPWLNFSCINDLDLMNSDLVDKIYLNERGLISLDPLKINDAVLEVDFSENLFHWYLEFFDIFDKKGGFDFIVANPPFLGSSSQGELSTLLRQEIGTGLDLSGRFFQRYPSLLTDKKHASISSLAPNSISQTKHRKQVLQPLFEEFDCWKAVRTKEWEGSANVQVALLHLVREYEEDGKKWLDNGDGYFKEVSFISTQLDEYPDQNLHSLCSIKHENMTYTGMFFRGDFTIYSNNHSSSLAAAADVPTEEQTALAAYINARDIQRRPYPQASDIVIDFFEPLNNAGLAEAAPHEQLVWLEKHFPVLLKQLRVRPQGESVFEFRRSLPLSLDNDPHREYWWLFGRVRKHLRNAWAQY